MIRKLLALTFLFLFSLSLVACSPLKNEKENTSEKEKTQTIKYLQMPENVKMASQTYRPDTDNGNITVITKLGNNMLRTDVTTHGEDMIPDNNKTCHYYQYKGNNLWDVYYKNNRQVWELSQKDLTSEKVDAMVNIFRVYDYITKPAPDCQHETVYVEGLGDVDTQIVHNADAANGGKVLYFYAESIHRYVKTISDVDSSTSLLTLYDTNVTSFEMDVPA